METQTLIRLVLGLLMTGVVLVFAARRILWLTSLIRSGQPVSDERGRKDHLGTRITTQIKEVFGQTRLLKWSIPGLAHFFTMWGFFVLATVYLEAYGLLFDPNFHIPFIGRWDGLGFLQDFFAVAVLLGIITFAIIRLRTEPKEHGRESRFYGSHTGGAWLILFMIFNVIWTYALVRGAAVNTETLPYGNGAFFSQLMGAVLHPLGHTANEWIETIALLLHIGVMLVFLLIVLHSKHLHIGLAPLNVTFKRLPNGLGPLLPMESKGKPINFEDPAEDDVFGRGKVEDFTWKGFLDFTTCTECGRCQSQCPAWNTGKPLSPKLVIMNLRDHMFAKAPYILGDKDMPDDERSREEHNPAEGGFIETHDEEAHHVPESGFERVLGSGPAQATRPLVGTAEQGGVIDPDVLWSCTTCGACVEQCPVDIEHIDHIVDMRRYQVMMESEFPGELGVLFKNLETKGNPWGQNAKDRTNWIDEVDFDVPVYGRDVESFEGYEYLFWVGCAGAYEDRAKKTTKAVAELLAIAGVKYLVLGEGETCNGDSARRSGNEFLFQQLAAQNVETLNDLFEGVERVDRKIVVTCPHCFNTLGREYPQVGGNLHGAAPHPAAEPADPGPQAGAGLARRRRCRHHLPRPVLPGPAQQGVRGAARVDRCVRCDADRDAAARRSRPVLRRRRRADVDGRAHRQAGQPRTRRGGAGHRRVEDRHRLPVLPGDDDRRRRRPRRGHGQGEGRGARRGAAAAGLAGQERRHASAEGRGRRGRRRKGGNGSQGRDRAGASRARGSQGRADDRGGGQAGHRAGHRRRGQAAGRQESHPGARRQARGRSARAKGLGIAAGAKRPGAKKTAPAAEVTAAAAETTAPAVKGLGIAAGAKRPGAKKTAPAAQTTAAAPETTAPEPQTASEPAVKGLGIAPGARRPGAKKATAPTQPAAAPPQPAAASPQPEPDGEASDDTGEAPAPPVKGLSIARGARPPGKR